MFKQLFSFYRQNLKLFIGVLSTCFVIVVFQTLVPAGTRIILNTYLPQGDLNKIIYMIVFLLIVTFFGAAASYAKTYYGHLLGANIERKMRIDMFKHFQTLDFSYFDQYKTGQMLSRLTTDLNYISEFAHHGAEEFFSSFIIIVIGIIYLGSINFSFMLIIYLFIATHISILYRNRSRMKKSMRIVRDELGEVNAKTESSLSAIRLTRAFNNEHVEIENYTNINNNYRNSWKKAYQDLAVVMSMNGLLLQATTIILIGIGSYGILNEIISFGDFMAFYLYFNILVASVRSIMGLIESFQQGATSLDRYNEVMSVSPRIVDHVNSKELSNVRGDINFNQVNFEYVSDNPVISNLNLDINSGQMVALVGESGIGKSTIVQLLPRFYDISGGNITIDGQDIKDLSLASLRKNIGFVQQDVTLFYGSIKDNILYGKPDASDEELINAIDKAKLTDFINSLADGIDTQVGEKGIILSGGQKQRISLARIFLKNPPILLLDEATSALDTITEKYIQKQIEELSKGRTVIVVAHRLSTIMQADKIYVLGKNGIIESGNHQELIDNDAYYNELIKANSSEFY